MSLEVLPSQILLERIAQQEARPRKKPASFSFSDNTFAEAKVISTLHRGASILLSGFEAKMSQGDTGDTTKAERHARSLSQGSSLLELISVSMSNQAQSQSGVLKQLKKSGTAVKVRQTNFVKRAPLQPSRLTHCQFARHGLSRDDTAVMESGPLQIDSRSGISQH